MRKSSKTLVVSAGLVLAGTTAWADCTPAEHVIAEGETVFTLSEAYYGEIEKWSLIFYANQTALANPLEIPAGTALTVPCPLGGSDFVNLPEP